MKRIFINFFGVLLLGSIIISSCNGPMENQDSGNTLGWNVSLAQWSLHKSFFGEALNGDWQKFSRLLKESPDSVYLGPLHPDNFPLIAKQYGISIIELVNTFYFSKAHDMEYWEKFRQTCVDNGVKVGLIMCDALGNMGDADEAKRREAIENHYPWVDIAAFLGAKTVRVNAGGDGTPEEVVDRVVESLTQLGKYGAEKGINIVVENHGGYSSNGAWLAGIMKRVNMDNVGTLPDFGNFCIERGPEGCLNEYDKYKGIEELMPYAKGVSAKTNDFGPDGNDTDKDYLRIMKIVKDSGFKGNVGIEYEGNKLSEDEGIKATQALLDKVFSELVNEEK